MQQKLFIRKIGYLCESVIRTIPMKTDDEIYMARCLQLATMAAGQTSPNPMVGAVVVHDGKIIGEGYHHRAGQPHAEPNAIASVQDDSLLRESTLYVSLEPCSHYGKTPPCAELIISKGIKRVVVATLDPNPRVSGRGIRMMQEAGIDVTVGILEDEARRLNRRFFTFQEKGRPYVLLKWAQTADGYIDATRSERGSGPVKISNTITKTLNHQVRTEEDAIMVATRTALLDDPHLTVTKWSGRTPLRVVLDRECKIPAKARIFDAAAPTLVFTSASSYSRRPQVPDNVEFEIIDFAQPLPQQVLNRLAGRGILSIIIEGGTQWLQTFIDEGIWDEARIETSPTPLDMLGVKAPRINGTVFKTEYYNENTIAHLQPLTATGSR